jgi:hypothetical protein
MTIEYDDKGKRFTDIVTKQPVYATVQTTKQLLRGNIHVRRDQRIKDELDLDDKFIAITDVSILSADGQVIFQAPFLAVNRAHIIWVLPEQKPSAGETA